MKESLNWINIEINIIRKDELRKEKPLQKQNKKHVINKPSHGFNQTQGLSNRVFNPFKPAS